MGCVRKIDRNYIGKPNTIGYDVRMNTTQANPVADLQKQLRETKREMRARGIRRTSMMNGGLSPDEMRFNEQCFRLETEIQRARAK